MSFFKSFKSLFSKPLPENFCIAPFIQMDLHEQGRVNACCKAKDKLGDWSEKKVSDIWNDKPMQSLRKQFLDGKKPRGCSTCWSEEEKGLVSRRINYNQTFQDQFQRIQKEKLEKGEVALERSLEFESLDVGFGAQCSLRCRMCGPSASSKWLSTAIGDKEVYQYFSDIGELNPQIVDTGFKDFLPDELFDDFAQNIAPNVGDLMISGGEPMNSENHFRLFHECLKDDQLAQMKVTLTTNAQTTEFKGVCLIPRWQKLKRFVYRISIDGVGDTYSYVRSGGDYEKVLASLKKVRDAFDYESGKLQMVSTVAVSLYNITRLPELIDFAISNGTFIHFNWVHFPDLLAIDNLPEELKELCLEQMTSNRQEVLKKDAWESHPLWCQPLRFDYNFEIFKKYLVEEKGFASSQDFTYGDYARERFADQIDEIILGLKSVDGRMRGRQAFRDHVKLLDRINRTNFLNAFPEYSQFMAEETVSAPSFAPTS